MGFNQAEYQRKWRAAHPNYSTEYNRKWRAAHPGYAIGYYAKNAERLRIAARKKYRIEHPNPRPRGRPRGSSGVVPRSLDEIRAANRIATAKYRAAHPDRLRASQRKQRVRAAVLGYPAQKKWRMMHPEKARALNKKANASSAHLALKIKRRAAEIQRTPAWADELEMQKVCATAKQLQRVLGRPVHVDHIVPLQGKTVSGLHVHYNLEPREAQENIRKGNRFCPFVEAVYWESIKPQINEQLKFEHRI